MEVAAEKSRSATVLYLQAWTYYNLYQTPNWRNLLSDLHVPDEQWALDRHFWCLFCLCLRVSVILHTCSLYPQQKCAYRHTLCYTRRPGPVYTGHTCRHLPSTVPWISVDRLLTVLYAWLTGRTLTRFYHVAFCDCEAKLYVYQSFKRSCSQLFSFSSFGRTMNSDFLLSYLELLFLWTIQKAACTFSFLFFFLFVVVLYADMLRRVRFPR